MAQHLQAALRPAQPLPPGDGERGRLLVIKYRLAAVADGNIGQDQTGGELAVLREQVAWPAAEPLDDGPGDEKAGAGEDAARPQEHPRAVQEVRPAQKPERAPGGDPAVAVVLRGPVAGDDGAAGGKGAVDLPDVVRPQQVVRVKDEVGVKRRAVSGGLHPREQKFQRPALAHACAVLPLPDNGPRGTGDGGGAVGAVVRRDEDLHQLGGIVLPADALDQLGDHRLLVARADEHGETVQPLRDTGCGVLFPEGDKEEEDLVAKAEGQQQPEGQVDGVHDVHRQLLSPAVLSCLSDRIAEKAKNAPKKSLRIDKAEGSASPVMPPPARAVPKQDAG